MGIVPGPYAVDASVFINAFNPFETGHAISQALLARLRDMAVPIISPTLMLPETAAAVSRGRDDADLARRFALTLSRIPHLVLIPLDVKLAQRALDNAAIYRLRGSDAVYAAAAQRYACPLVTLDQEQHERVAAALKTYYPVDLLAEL